MTTRDTLRLIAFIMMALISCRMQAQSTYLSESTITLSEFNYGWWEPDTIELLEITDIDELIEVAVDFNEIAFWIVLRSMQIYVDECYNDSTYVERHPYYLNLPDGIVTTEYNTVYEWTHKQPTFEGYVKWMTKHMTWK